MCGFDSTRMHTYPSFCHVHGYLGHGGGAYAGTLSAGSPGYKRALAPADCTMYLSPEVFSWAAIVVLKAHITIAGNKNNLRNRETRLCVHARLRKSQMNVSTTCMRNSGTCVALI